MRDAKLCVCGVLAISIISSCSSKQFPRIEDTCKATGRSLSRSEKIYAAASYLYDQADHVRWVDMITYRDSNFPNYRPSDKVKIIKSYIRENAECCRLVEPTPIRDRWDRGDGYEHTADQMIKFQWVNDALFWRDRPFKSDNGRNNILDVRVSNCGNVDQIDRG